MKPTLANIYNPHTGIINPPTLLTKITNKEQLKSYTDKRPATIVFEIDKNLKGINELKDPFIDLEDVIKEYGNGFIIGIETNSLITVKLVSKYFKKQGIIDFCIVSEKKEVIIEAKRINPFARGIFKLNKVINNTLEIRTLVNQANAHTVLLNASILTQALVSHLQIRGITVFALAKSLKEAKLSLFKGVNGIFSEDPLHMISLYETITNKTHLKDVHFVAHRGLHNGPLLSVGPENSLEAAIEAVKNGVKIIEIDIHLTKDNEVVVIHDAKTTRTTNLKHIVSKMSLEDLMNIPLTDTQNQRKRSFIMPFQAFLKEFQGKEIIIFLETKPVDKLLISKAFKLIKKYQMEEWIVFISFQPKNIFWQSKIHSINTGLLTSKLNKDKEVSTVYNVMQYVIPSKTTYNPQHLGITPSLAKEFTHRGISVFAWTVNDINDMTRVYNSGIEAITTDYFDHVKDIKLYTKHPHLTRYQIGQSAPLEIKGIISSMSGLSEVVYNELLVIDDGGTGIVCKKNAVIGALNMGTAYLYTVSLIEFPNGVSFYKSSNIIEVEVILDSQNG